MGEQHTNKAQLRGYGSRLRHERVRLGLTQQEIAEQSGISRVQLGKYEREIVNLSKKSLSRLATLGVDISYVIAGDKDRLVEFEGLTTEEMILINWLRNATKETKDKVVLELFYAGIKL